MKKFMQEFKAFALRGNVMDMAIGVIIGGAFSAIVGSLTENIILPIIGSFGGTEIGLVTPLANGQVINWGAVITAILNFIIIAFILFCMLKAVNKAVNAAKKPVEEKPAEPKKSDELKALEEIIALLKDKK
ncbi:MAG: large conductance mechanosensitive channel protein MscL [Solobacterium sp.]|nr:large conductance mechanosensitive channel protein MscL [Solobacterium sp.]